MKAKMLPSSLSDLGRRTRKSAPARPVLPDLQAHSRAMGQKAGEKWIAAVDLQPTTPKSDRLLGRWLTPQKARDVPRWLALYPIDWYG